MPTCLKVGFSSCRDGPGPWTWQWHGTGWPWIYPLFFIDWVWTQPCDHIKVGVGWGRVCSPTLMFQFGAQSIIQTYVHTTHTHTYIHSHAFLFWETRGQPFPSLRETYKARKHDTYTRDSKAGFADGCYVVSYFRLAAYPWAEDTHPVLKTTGNSHCLLNLTCF